MLQALNAACSPKKENKRISVAQAPGTPIGVMIELAKIKCILPWSRLIPYLSLTFNATAIIVINDDEYVNTLSDSESSLALSDGLALVQAICRHQHILTSVYSSQHNEVTDTTL